MANTLLVTLRSLYSPLRRDVVKLSNTILSQSTRSLYAKATLGLDTFVQQKQQIRQQMGNIEEKFKEKMNTFATEDSKNMIFTEDLKNMIYLAEADDDFDLIIKMMKKFNGQNKQLRFGNFVFGPVVMRLFHIYNKPELALECFNSPQLEGFFDQLITYQILLDLLYENEKYEEMLRVFETIQSRQLEATKYPRNAVVLAMAACYKLNSQESLDYALKLWKQLGDAGHFPMRRATTFCAGLALNQGKPEAAMEILAAVRKPNYVTIRNLKVRALSEIGRLDEAIVILKSVISEDVPGNVPHTFNRDVMERVKSAVLKMDNPDVSLEFNRLETLFEKQGHVSNSTLDEQLCAEIQQPPVMHNRQENRFSRYDPKTRRNQYSDTRQRPGLKDLM
ncbi:pentatricopeptide repeat-containing protein 2, mitochondrial-like [Asbolus verrucosus]|uniref:Pentatricopeptide repeat-containing protein 2, mitochondrial-like n=1 Tax=Asbolus verrucosus TaxID=1661398 RepID=A0A482VVX7_ASBVE|nr:pentatricopeptide repeat-containing protein 2, mitochondrial-like [Asbolus verrucosus]